MIHVFEQAGLGKAPFTCIGVASIPDASMAECNPLGYMNAMKALPKGAGSCKFCGMPLIHNYIIKDSLGGTFVVGCECVNKTDDAGLIDKTVKVKKAHEKAIRAEKSAKKKADIKAQREAELKEKQDAFILENPKEVHYLFENKDKNFFLGSLYSAFKQWGNLTPGQLNALRKNIDQDNVPVLPSTHQGNIGDRIKVNVKVTRIATIPCMGFGYGDRLSLDIITLQDATGNVYVVKTKAYLNIDVSDEISLIGTVKDHSEYKGVNQTILQRVKVLSKVD